MKSTADDNDIDIETRHKMYRKLDRQTAVHVHTCMFCGESGTEISTRAPAPQPAPDACEWRVELSNVQGYYIVDADGNEVIRDAYAPKSLLEQIVSDHRSAAAVPKLEAEIERLETENRKLCIRVKELLDEADVKRGYM